jgi:pathogenesis-related protein 1
MNDGLMIPIVIKEKEKVEEEFSEEIVNMIRRNNEIRAEVFEGAKIEWNIAIAASAQEHADYLAKNDLFTHSNSGYGENLYASSANVSYVDAVNKWYSEKKDFNLINQSCTTGKICGHYTQLIWKDTLEVGCATSSSASWNTIVVCQYNPPGNYRGELVF